VPLAFEATHGLGEAVADLRILLDFEAGAEAFNLLIDEGDFLSQKGDALPVLVRLRGAEVGFQPGHLVFDGLTTAPQLVLGVPEFAGDALATFRGGIDIGVGSRAAGLGTRKRRRRPERTRRGAEFVEALLGLGDQGGDSRRRALDGRDQSVPEGLARLVGALDDGLAGREEGLADFEGGSLGLVLGFTEAALGDQDQRLGEIPGGAHRDLDVFDQGADDFDGLLPDAGQQFAEGLIHLAHRRGLNRPGVEPDAAGDDQRLDVEDEVAEGLGEERGAFADGVVLLHPLDEPVAQVEQGRDQFRQRGAGDPLNRHVQPAEVVVQRIGTRRRLRGDDHPEGPRFLHHLADAVRPGVEHRDHAQAFLAEEFEGQRGLGDAVRHRGESGRDVLKKVGLRAEVPVSRLHLDAEGDEGVRPGGGRLREELQRVVQRLRRGLGQGRGVIEGGQVTGDDAELLRGLRRLIHRLQRPLELRGQFANRQPGHDGAGEPKGEPADLGCHRFQRHRDGAAELAHARLHGPQAGQLDDDFDRVGGHDSEVRVEACLRHERHPGGGGIEEGEELAQGEAHDPVRRVTLPDQEIDRPGQRVVTVAVTAPCRAPPTPLSFPRSSSRKLIRTAALEKRERLRGGQRFQPRLRQAGGLGQQRIGQLSAGEHGFSQAVGVQPDRSIGSDSPAHPRPARCRRRAFAGTEACRASGVRGPAPVRCRCRRPARGPEVRVRCSWITWRAGR
jgi:hypothetical protein